MVTENSTETHNALVDFFRKADVARPMRVQRYEPSAELTYDVTGLSPAKKAEVRLRVVKFVGGGFAGQVYKVEMLRIDAPDGAIDGLEVGGQYAMKILIPPTTFSRLFRDAIYKIGFQSPFSLQVNPAAARAGALWQKFIRRGAKVQFGAERAVVDVLGTFVDATLGSCGELSEWVDGRVWRFEVNDQLDARKRWKPSQPVDLAAGSPEYCAKRRFMAEFVRLLHDMGAPELARQYEWWTCKSQPNALKRCDTEDDPLTGLTAVDFRAGLALLPLLPMSPGDFKLILAGLRRGSLVQFDRGDLKKLKLFVQGHPQEFADMQEAFEELQTAERQYRDSQIDITHNHIRLLYDRTLWSNILDGAVRNWSICNITDTAAAASLRRSRTRTVIFALLGLVPVWWKAVRKLWGRADYRRHYAMLLNDGNYLVRAFRGHAAEAMIRWYRGGRISSERVSRMLNLPQRELSWQFVVHMMLSLLPGGLHRFFTDRRFALEKLKYIFVRPVRLYFNAESREQWLRDMVAAGRANHMLSDEDAETILSRIKEPFIQKYLKSLAVHVCTLPITQIVSVTVALVYVMQHPELSLGQAWTRAGAILVAFQFTPISPGSLVRGLYVLYLVIKERNFKDYNIAVFLGFFKYVGYLAFPIQMAYRYPTLARFMAGHWATGAVHIVPVFGERGALLEHAVFDLFYNYPLTVRKRLKAKGRARVGLKRRLWHLAPIAVCTVGLFALTDWAWIKTWGHVPPLRRIWWLVVLLPTLAGAMATGLAGRTSAKKRIILAVIVGLLCAVGYTAVHGGMYAYTAYSRGAAPAITWMKVFAAGLLWPAFTFTAFAVLGALLAELFWPAPRAARASRGPIAQDPISQDQL